MRLDHIVFAAGPDGLDATAARLGKLLGEEITAGGIHPRFGTRNRILPLTKHTYLEVVEVLDHPASDKAPFGQAVRARSELGGGWMGWVVAVDDIGPHEQRLGREAVNGNRKLPDGTELLWKQLGVKGLQADPQLPFFVQFISDDSMHPSHGGSGKIFDWTLIPDQPGKTAVEMFDAVLGRATDQGLRVRAYVSMCFGDPWEGSVALERVVVLIDADAPRDRKPSAAWRLDHQGVFSDSHGELLSRGIGWAAWGAWDLAIGIRRELDDKKDKGIQSVILGALLGTVLKTLFSALAAGLQAIG